MRIAALGLAVSALLVLAGCTATTVGHGAPAPGVAVVDPTPAPTASPVLWSITQAQQYYLQYIYQGDADYTYLDSLPCNCNGQLSYSDLTGVCQRIVVDNNLTIYDFSNGAWPTIAVPSINALITAMRLEQKGYTDCANAKTVSAASAGLREVVPITPQALAARRVLGLPLTANPSSTPTTSTPTPTTTTVSA